MVCKWFVSGLGMKFCLFCYSFSLETTPLHLATESGHIKIVKYLCDEGAAVNIQDDDGVNLNAGRLAA